MSVTFHHHNSLRLFAEIARYSSFSDAADAMNMTKGAISYQIKTLETDLDMVLFRRSTRGVTLTPIGKKVLAACKAQYEEIEAQLRIMRGTSLRTLTVGVSTYFAARWLSSRLMSFMEDQPDIQIRLQPMIRLFQLEDQGVDIAIRWGDGTWDDAKISPFMRRPAFPVGNVETFKLVKRVGFENAIKSLTLLRDHDDSNAWTDWLETAGLSVKSRNDALIVPDPNVRVQAVINGQGIALMDDLIQNEIKSGHLMRLSDVALSNYGYFLARPTHSQDPKSVAAFVDWIHTQK